MPQFNRDDIAQRSANQLIKFFGDDLPAQVSKELANPRYASTDESNQNGWDSIAALIVAIVSLSVQINDSFFRDNQRYPSNEELCLTVDKEVADKTSNHPLPSALSQHLKTVIHTIVDEAIPQ